MKTHLLAILLGIMSQSLYIAFFSDEAVQNLVEGGLNAALSVINTGTCDTRLN